jgi:hypothetical protein
LRDLLRHNHEERVQGYLKQLNEDWDLMRKFYYENLKGPAINLVSDKFGFSKY